MSEILKGIAEQQQKEAERQIYEILKSEFSKRLKTLIPWKATSIWHAYDLGYKLLWRFSKEVIRNACRNLGIRVYCINWRNIYISIPRYNKKREMTKAQKWLHEFNAEYLECVENAKASARKESDELIVKLMNRQYSAISHYNGYSRITIGYYEPFEPKYSETQVFIAEVYEKIKKYGFSKVSFSYANNVAEWKLYVKDSQTFFK